MAFLNEQLWHPLVHKLSFTRRLRVVRVSTFDDESPCSLLEREICYRVLDDSNEKIFSFFGQSFNCLMSRRFESFLRTNVEGGYSEGAARLEKVPDMDSSCFCTMLCKNKTVVKLLGYDENFGTIKENCANQLFPSYTLQLGDQLNSSSSGAQLRGPPLISGLLGIGQLKFLQPRVEFRLLDGTGKQFGTIVRKSIICDQILRSSLEQCEIEYPLWISPQLKLLILCSVFMLVSLYRCKQIPHSTRTKI